MKIVWWILLGVAISVTIALLISVIIFFVNVSIHYKGKHHCNYCERSFLMTRAERDYKHCPYCSKELDYHFKDERCTYNFVNHMSGKEVLIDEQKLDLPNYDLITDLMEIFERSYYLPIYSTKWNKEKIAEYEEKRELVEYGESCYYMTPEDKLLFEKVVKLLNK